MYFGVVCPEPRQPKAAFSVPCDGGSGAIFINWDYFHFPDSKTRDLRAVQNASPCRCETLVLCLACLQFSSVLFFAQVKRDWEIQSTGAGAKGTPFRQGCHTPETSPCDPGAPYFHPCPAWPVWAPVPSHLEGRLCRGLHALPPGLGLG